MGIVSANILAANHSLFTAAYTTSSVTIAAGRLELLTVGIAWSATPLSLDGGITSVTGLGQSWSRVDAASISNNGDGTHWQMVELFRCMSGVATTGSVVITPNNANHFIAWALVEVSGVDTSGTNGSGAIVQTAKVQNISATQATITLAAFSNINNATYGTFGAGDSSGIGRTFTPGTGFTELADTAEQYSAVCAEFVETNDTTVDVVTSAVTLIGGIALEIKAAVVAAAQKILALTGVGR